jgi:hypothetical protein
MKTAAFRPPFWNLGYRFRPFARWRGGCCLPPWLRLAIGRELENAGPLAGPQPGQQHDFAIRKLQRIVMRVGQILIDMTEAGGCCAGADRTEVQAEEALFHDRRIECQLGARSQAHRDVEIAAGCEPASRRMLETRGLKSVAHLGGSADLVFKTVVTHGHNLRRDESAKASALFSNVMFVELFLEQLEFIMAQSYGNSGADHAFFIRDLRCGQSP